MSSKIYFSGQQKKRALSYYLVKGVSATLTRITPTFALKQTKKLLLTPAKSRQRPQLPTHFEQTMLNTQYGKLNKVAVGKGKSILLTHGWSGSCAQFYPLMEKIAEHGYRAVAFDHFAHGQSGGRYANLPLFIKGLNAVAQSEKASLSGIISHSMGTIAALNQIKDIPQVLIAPTFDFYNAFESRILATGMSQLAFRRVLKEIEQDHDVKFSDLLPEQHLHDHQAPLLAIHDIDDKYAPFHLTEAQANQHTHLQLSPVTGHGHGRIINADQTWQGIKAHLLSERN